MPTEIYALTQDNRMLRNALDKRDRAIKDLTELLHRYMQHVIETKGTSYLDRYGLMPTDSKALRPWDIAVLQAMEKEVRPKCAMPSRVGGSSAENSGATSMPDLPPQLPGAPRLP